MLQLQLQWMQSIIGLLVTGDKKAGLKSFDKKPVSDKHKCLALHWFPSSHFSATRLSCWRNKHPIRFFQYIRCNPFTCQLLPTPLNKFTHLLNLHGFFLGGFSLPPYFVLGIGFTNRLQGTNIHWQSTSPRAAHDYARIPRWKVWRWHTILHVDI